MLKNAASTSSLNARARNSTEADTPRGGTKTSISKICGLDELRRVSSQPAVHTALILDSTLHGVTTTLGGIHSLDGGIVGVRLRLCV